MSNRFELPSINVEQRSNEQNMQSVKSYLTDFSARVDYYLTNLENQLMEQNKKKEDS
nr:hypothetical protein [uncultured Agathobacter sp.]